MAKFYTFKVDIKHIDTKEITKTVTVNVPAMRYDTHKDMATALYNALGLSGVKVQTIGGMNKGLNLYFECSKKDRLRYICTQVKTATVEINVPMQRIADMLVGAFEGGYSPWLHTSTNATKHESHTWYSEGESLCDDGVLFSCIFDSETDAEGDGTGAKDVTREDLLNALQLMAIHSPSQFGDLVAENDDAFTADCYMQYVLIGSVIYG